MRVLGFLHDRWAILREFVESLLQKPRIEACWREVDDHVRVIFQEFDLALSRSSLRGHAKLKTPIRIKLTLASNEMVKKPQIIRTLGEIHNLLLVYGVGRVEGYVLLLQSDGDCRPS